MFKFAFKNNTSRVFYPCCQRSPFDRQVLSPFVITVFPLIAALPLFAALPLISAPFWRGLKNKRPPSNKRPFQKKNSKGVHGKIFVLKRNF